MAICLSRYTCCQTCVSASISSSQCVMSAKLYTAAEALWSSEVYEFAPTLNPPRRTTHTLMQTRRHKPRPAPPTLTLPPTHPLPPWKTIPLHLILVPGCMRAALGITSGPTARVCHLARQHDPSCQSCFIIVTFSYSLAKWREGRGQVTRTHTHMHKQSTLSLFLHMLTGVCQCYTNLF